ncbi:MAG: GNAT family N-acetyltransferase [Planctomycetes bacterium]|nr:GNAT family N-acetyltransferase [Planctomycetota bacterium]
MSDATPRFLDWDTQFFGVRIASLSALDTGPLDGAAMEQALAWCRDERIACLYLRSDSDDVTTLRAAGAHAFRFVDVRVTLDCPVGTMPMPTVHEGVRTAKATDVPALRAIAAYNHRNTRFYADGRFDPARCDELYATWIEKSVNGWAERVLVSDAGAGALGYLSIHLRPEETAEIGLVGLAREAQGQGLGKKLVESSLAWMRSKGLQRATVVTQGRNIAAQRLYQAAGFRTRSMELWHHRWFDAS